LDKSIERFYFDILIRDKYPFQPPIIMTRTTFCSPSLADGRDLLYQIIPEKLNKESDNNDNNEGEWLPSMSLYELIQYIPDFIADVLRATNGAGKDQEQRMLGKFYLGLNYDYQ